MKQPHKLNKLLGFLLSLFLFIAVSLSIAVVSIAQEKKDPWEQRPSLSLPDHSNDSSLPSSSGKHKNFNDHKLKKRVKKENKPKAKQETLPTSSPTSTRENEIPGSKIKDKQSFIAHGWENIQPEMAKVNDKLNLDLKKEFPLGYKLFAIANKEFFPFQGTSDIKFLVHWERQNYSFESNDSTITLHLPDIDVHPNMMLYGTTVSLPNEIGASITFRLDPIFFKQGAAIVSNVFERRGKYGENKSNTPKTTLTPDGAILSNFPGSDRIAYIIESTILWGSGNSYKLGSVGKMSEMLKISGGVLHTSRVNICDEAKLIRDNTFVGGPRGGYRFPKAATLIGNYFQDTIFDASSIPDNAIIANNHFVSPRGVFRIGPEPELSFVVKIVKTATNGAVLLFGAKPYKDEE